jgi:endonuclease/exonuclease/phosphatase family metal-dependent hydrolase
VHHYVELSGSRKIDYIMCDTRWHVHAADIVRDEAAGRLPSDHFPVLADLVPIDALHPQVAGVEPS